MLLYLLQVEKDQSQIIQIKSDSCTGIGNNIQPPRLHGRRSMDAFDGKHSFAIDFRQQFFPQSTLRATSIKMHKVQRFQGWQAGQQVLLQAANTERHIAKRSKQPCVCQFARIIQRQDRAFLHCHCQTKRHRRSAASDGTD